MSTVTSARANSEIHLETSPFLFSEIVVGTDFSKPAKRALQTAEAIALAFKGSLTVVNSTPLLTPTLGMEVILPEVMEAGISDARRRLASVLSRDGADSVHPDLVVSYQGATDLIIETAKSRHADLIAVGSHSATGLERVALGSVAETILREAECPVLIAGPRCRETTHPFRSILFATDLDATGLRAAQYATSLAGQFRSRLTLLHVLEHKDKVSVSERITRESDCLKRLTELIPSHLTEVERPQTKLAYGTASEEILAEAERVNASLIVIGVGRHTGVIDHLPWNTVCRVVREARCPILGIRGHL